MWDCHQFQLSPSVQFTEFTAKYGQRKIIEPKKENLSESERLVRVHCTGQGKADTFTLIALCIGVWSAIIGTI